MTSNITIDIAGRDERDIITIFVLDQFAEHSIQVEQKKLAQSIESALINDKLGIFLIARDRGKAIGFAYVSFVWSLEHCGHSAWLEEFYVVPEQRGLGIGRQLLAEVTRIAREKECAAIDVEVEHSLSRAENLYSREEFIKLSRNRWVRGLK
jgi:GNAT superfamily N-acetyltransferase